MDVLMIDAIEKAIRNPMHYGIDDCCLWVSDRVNEICGIDPAAPLRGYNSKVGAAKVLKLFAGAGLPEAAVKLAGQAGFKPVARPYRGNLVAVVAAAEGPMLAILWRNRWVVRSVDGVSFLPLNVAVMAWRFPCQF